MAAVALAVRVTSPGPVILRLTCIGAGQRQFGQYRFRIVYQDQERRSLRHALRLGAGTGGDGSLQDPRLTPLGRFLVRSGLNRLPQIVNVLRGEMSFVGPQAIPIVRHSANSDLEQKLLRVRPGIFTPESLHPDQSPQSEFDRKALALAYSANPCLPTDTWILLTLFSRFFGGRRGSV